MQCRRRYRGGIILKDVSLLNVVQIKNKSFANTYSFANSSTACCRILCAVRTVMCIAFATSVHTYDSKYSFCYERDLVSGRNPLYREKEGLL